VGFVYFLVQRNFVEFVFRGLDFQWLASSDLLLDRFAARSITHGDGFVLHLASRRSWALIIAFSNHPFNVSAKCAGLCAAGSTTAAYLCGAMISSVSEMN
jgi:hypothetical protein